MKTVKLFFSSSVVEFEELRDKLRGYFTVLNNTFVERGFFLKPFFCEDYDNNVVKEGKQEEYNQEVRASQYFYIIVGEKAGDWTVEEFEEAYKSFDKTGTPIIRTYFQDIPDDQLQESARYFKNERVGKQIKHIYSKFTHIDTIKLNLLTVLTKDLLLHSTVKFENGQAMLDNVPIMSLENVPMYSKHPKVQELIAERAMLDNEFVEISKVLSKSPDSDWLIKQRYALDEKRTKINEQLRTMERDLYDLYKTTEDKRKSGKSINWRERKAIELLEDGDAITARNVLNDAEWKNEINFAEEVIEKKKDKIREYISGKRTEISIIKAVGVTTETEQEIIGIYEEITALAEKHKIELMTLYDYASFLEDQCQYPNGIKVAGRLLKYFELDENTSDEDLAMLKNQLGNLYCRNNDYKNGEELYRESLEIRRRLAKTNPGAYEPYVAMSCNNLAVLLDDNNRHEEAEELYRESLEIYRKLAEINPGAYEPDVAMSCNNLAVLLADNNQYEEAEELYRESLEIRRRLAKTNPVAYEPYVAMSCNNLAVLLDDNNHPKEAEELYRESLEIRRRLAKTNPGAYEPYVATSCNNLANLLANNNRFEEAAKLHKESLEIRRRLAKTNPGAYEPYLADSCFNYAVLLFNYKNDKSAAKAHFEEALGYYEKFPHLEAKAQKVRNILKKFF